MSALPPLKKDRTIAELPQCFSRDAALHTNEEFHSKVKTACSAQRTGVVGFSFAKVIVVGDVAAGKTSLINRFCRDSFVRNYKATIGVDFEMERFEVLGVPFSLQLWDTAGQERFKCIASTYYRGAQAIIVVFDLSNTASLDHARQWLEESMEENDPSSILLFLVGAKKDLSVSPTSRPIILCRNPVNLQLSCRSRPRCWHRWSTTPSGCRGRSGRSTGRCRPSQVRVGGAGLAAGPRPFRKRVSLPVQVRA
uniref:Ras-related protein Rab-34 n=1 Tax=Denticeps clupeoides TaxID=299321 RepID=A0AAY4D8J1_9TELE